MRWAAVALLAAAAVARAAEPPAMMQGEPVAPPRWLKGPARVDLGHGFVLELPAGFSLLRGGDAAHALATLGRDPGTGLLAVAAHADEPWLVRVFHDDAGFVRDDGAVDPSALLARLRQGAAALNAARVRSGRGELSVDGWATPPAYDSGTHRVGWAFTQRDAGSTSVEVRECTLGRAGAVCLDLVAAAEHVDAARPHVRTLAAAGAFAPGARWEDFHDGQDPVAPAGMAGLVARASGLAAEGPGTPVRLTAALGTLARLAREYLVVLVAVGYVLARVALAQWRKRRART